MNTFLILFIRFKNTFFESEKQLNKYIYIIIYYTYLYIYLFIYFIKCFLDSKNVLFKRIKVLKKYS